MSHSVTFIIIIVIIIVRFNSICPSSLTMINPCEIPNLIELQSAIYRYTYIIRVPSAFLSESFDHSQPVHEVRVREIIKMPMETTFPLNINDLIRIHFDEILMEILDDSCWQYLRLSNIDLILFLNETNHPEEFQLLYPPVESTIRVRQNLDTVLHYETYSPQVIIKSPMDLPYFSEDYLLQCNARGNPLPRLYWTKQNSTFEDFPTHQQCLTKTCRIYSIQNKYQSTLYFHSLMWTDSGVYACHAENPINSSLTNIEIYIEAKQNELNQTSMNISCSNLNFCHRHGQCILVRDVFRCLCDSKYFGDECEMNYDAILVEQDNMILVLKSRFLAVSLLMMISLILLCLTIISCSLARHRRNKSSSSSSSSCASSSHPSRKINQDKILSNGLSPIVDKDEEIISSSSDNPCLSSYQQYDHSGLIRPLSFSTDIPLRYVYPRSMGKSE